MKEQYTSAHSPSSDTPYDTVDAAAVNTFWGEATAHTGLHELRAKRGRPKKAAGQKKEQIALRVDADVLAWYRSQGSGWQTRMNAVLRAHRDAPV